MEKNDESVGKTGVAVDGVLFRINDLGEKCTSIHGFFVLPVPYSRWKYAGGRLASAPGRRAEAAVDQAGQPLAQAGYIMLMYTSRCN